MTAARRRPRGNNLTTVAVAVFIGAVLILLGVLQLAKNPNVKNNLGAPVFEAGRAKDLSAVIASGGPLLFQALLGNRDIYVQHLGDDPLAGWISFEAHAPGAPRTCAVQWQAPEHQFRDPCTGTIYPAAGTGLIHYAASVDPASKRVVVDLRQAVP